MSEKKKLTNMERLMCMTTPEFISEVSRIFTHQLSIYIDYEKYLNSSDPDILSALIVIGKAKIKPSEAAQKAYVSSHRDDPELDRKLEEYIKLHTVPCKLLEKCRMYGKPYWVILTNGSENVTKTPEENIIDIDLS